MKIITDTFGRLVGSGEEPPLASVVLVGGETGVAWQRMHRTGKWHHTDGRIRSWNSMLGRRNLVLVYEAPAREAADQPVLFQPPAYNSHGQGGH